MLFGMDPNADLAIPEKVKGRKKSQFFDYIKTARQLCQGQPINQKCSDYGSIKENFDTNNIMDCVWQSFGLTNGEKLSLKPDMQPDNLILAENTGRYLVPSVKINGEVFRGTVNPDNVFEAICMGFIQMP